MNLTIKRVTFGKTYTLGTLSVDGKFECFTLEDAVRDSGVKLYGQTAIPVGTYSVDVTFSQRFQKPLPLLLNVPNFEGIRIHSGNTSKDTEGCILVGRIKSSEDYIGESKLAFEHLFSQIQAAKASNTPIKITISY